MKSLSPSFYQNLARFIGGHSFHVVGGAVRDRLLNRPVYDLDLIVPTQAPIWSEKIARHLKGKAFPLDLKRNIFRITWGDNQHIDLAVWQEKSLETDLARRDFPINALAVPLRNWGQRNWCDSIIDQHKGRADLKNKHLSPLSEKIFSDDPLRLLRCFRIAAELNFKLSPRLISLIKKDRNKLKKVAPERSRDEFLKLLTTPHSYDILKQMENTGLLTVFYPEAEKLKKTAPGYYGSGGVLKHTLDSVLQFEEMEQTLSSWFPKSASLIKKYLDERLSGSTRSAHCKWALLLHDIGKPQTAKMMQGRLRFFEHEHVGAQMVNKMATRYRWSGEETDRYSRLVKHHMRPGNLASQSELSTRAINRFFRDLGDDSIAMLLVSLADHLTYLSPRQRKKRNSDHEQTTIRMIHRYYHEREKVLPPRLVNGNDIMKLLKISPSPLIGTLLEKLTEAQADGIVNSKKEALGFLKDFYATVR